ncbi:MAG: hypothetical protein LCH74_17690 [Proteobacteria bacterium]|jgi:hypothetical protein|uniref:SLOG domain-containing protein n=1 Tax=Sphingopyxis terrae TaxID=33052 RepID=UPI000786996B|nr:hypothetical protein [Sphingopyxis terrae]MCA0210896.1 hypothetical protein [Pseudomonadota bacterium]
MMDAIFLSAGVPDPRRGPEYAATADTVAITAAVSALVYVTLGRRPLIWGGHPAITPMIWVIAEDLGLDYGRWVGLYQSRHFEDQFPQDNARFGNVTLTDDIAGDRAQSLLHMRRRMFSEHRFAAAVFIGGMGGIIDEYDLFRELQPEAAIIPVVSTGGAAIEVGKRLDALVPDLADDPDYVALFHRHLGVSAREQRFANPDAQPRDIEARYWRPPE